MISDADRAVTLAALDGWWERARAVAADIAAAGVGAAPSIHVYREVAHVGWSAHGMTVHDAALLLTWMQESWTVSFDEAGAVTAAADGVTIYLWGARSRFVAAYSPGWSLTVDDLGSEPAR